MAEAVSIVDEPVTAGMKQATQITEYDPITAALGDLRKKYHEVAYDVSTTAGMKQATQARAEIRGYRVALEAKRKEIKAPALERCRAIDTVAKHITEQLLLLEAPIDQQIKAEERRKEEERERKAREESERKAKIMMEVNRISSMGDQANGKTSEEILVMADQVRAIELDRDFFGAEFFDVAESARTSAYGRLLAAHSTAKAQEEEHARIAAERAELDRLRREQEAQRAEIARLKAEADAKHRAEEERLRKEREAAETKLKAEREAEQARIRMEREAEGARLAAIRKQQEEEARKQAEEHARIEAEKAEIARRKAEQEAEAMRLKQYKAKLKAARMSSPVEALVRIWKICEDASDPVEAIREIAIIAQANIDEEMKI